MKNEKTRVVTLLLASLLLTSCGGAAQTPEETGTTGTVSDTVTSEPEETASPLPERDFEGREFRMFIRGDDSFIPDMWAEDLDGDTMNDAIYERNRRVADRYNVEFTVRLPSGDMFGESARNVIMAGEDAWDLLVCHGRLLFQYSYGDLLLEWNDNLPYIDLRGEWWNQDARENLSIGGKLYTCAGDISYMNLGAADCMFGNKRLLDELGVKDIYGMVLDGGWTFDRFSEIARAGAADLNGDTVIDEKNDRIGYMTTEWIGPMQVLYTGGQRIWNKNADDSVYLSLNTERTVDIYEKYFALTDSDAGYIVHDWIPDEIVRSFTSARSVFVDTNVKNVSLFRGMADDFCILPWPKYDETEDRYRSNVDAGCNMIGVPVTNTEPEMTSIIIEALCRDGAENVMPLYYETVLQAKYTRDDDSVRMLDLIRDGRVFDIGYYFSTGGADDVFNSTGYYLSRDSGHNFSSFYAKNEQSARADIDAVNAHYKEK